MNRERIQELAALAAVGALDGQDLLEWEQHLAQGGSEAQSEIASFRDTIAQFAVSVAGEEQAPSSLRSRILGKVAASKLSTSDTIRGQDGFGFIRASETQAWKALPIPGAYVQLLSSDPTRGYAVLLGKLEPGTHYPPHFHTYSEQIYVLTGDLHISDEVLRAGDFHSAAAGTAHGDNYSEEGCTILAVLSLDHPLAKFAMA